MHYLTSNEWVHQILRKRDQKHVFFIKDDKVWEKYENIWDVIKNKLGIQFHSEPIYEQKYLEAKVRGSDSMIKTNFLSNNRPKESMHYACIACITIGSVMRMGRKTIRRFN